MPAAEVLRRWAPWAGWAAVVAMAWALGRWQPRSRFVAEPAPSGPVAVARLQGGPLMPNLHGTVTFEPVAEGTLVRVEVVGLPAYRPAVAATAPIGPHGFHVHAVGSCEVGRLDDPFLAAGPHYDPDRQPHGNHAGDLPVLFSHEGRAWLQVRTSRFRPSDVLGRSVIVHEHPDDFRTQPAGASGRRLACGVIEPAPNRPRTR